MGSNPVAGSENSFSEYFDLRTLHYLHFIQVTNPFIIYSHLSFRHVEPCSMARHMSHIYEPSIWPCSPPVSHSSVVIASNRYLEGHGFDSSWGLRKFIFWVFRLENASSLFKIYQLKISTPICLWATVIMVIGLKFRKQTFQTAVNLRANRIDLGKLLA